MDEGFAFAAWFRTKWPASAASGSRVFNTVALDIWRRDHKTVAQEGK